MTTGTQNFHQTVDYASGELADDHAVPTRNFHQTVDYASRELADDHAVPTRNFHQTVDYASRELADDHGDLEMLKPRQTVWHSHLINPKNKYKSNKDKQYKLLVSSSYVENTLSPSNISSCPLHFS